MRADQCAAAKAELERALAMGNTDGSSENGAYYFLAMAEHHLGNEQAAGRQLEAANESANEELADSPAWSRRLTLELLRNEAEELIGKRKASMSANSVLFDDRPHPSAH